VKLRVCSFVVFVVVLACAAPLAASPCAAYPAGTWRLDKSSALQFEREWLQVLKQKNTAALDCMLASDFKDVSTKGIVRPKAQVLREMPLRNDQYQQTLTEMEADLFGNTAIARGLSIITDQVGHEVLRIRFTDVLCFTNGRWLAVASQETAAPQQQSTPQPPSLTLPPQPQQH
jgi:Domain of unknown function (DUF4440)